jgi:hypothetical protein
MGQGYDATNSVARSFLPKENRSSPLPPYQQIQHPQYRGQIDKRDQRNQAIQKPYMHSDEDQPTQSNWYQLPLEALPLLDPKDAVGKGRYDWKGWSSRLFKVIAHLLRQYQ